MRRYYQGDIHEFGKTLIGGAPVTWVCADEIGADGVAGDAISAVDLAYRLIDAPA
jgi:methanogenic corrinoid protein MtbC1